MPPRASTSGTAFRRFRLAGVLCLSLFVSPLLATDARADGEPRIVLVAQSASDPISIRIRAELRSLNFEVIDSNAPVGPPSRVPLEEIARQSHAVAAVRIVPSSTGVEVWIVDRVTGKTVLREMVSAETRSLSGRATIALRVVELLRASLMELNAPQPPPGEVEPPPAVRQLIEPELVDAPPPKPLRPALSASDASFSAELGPAALVSPGGMSYSGLLGAGIHILPESTIGGSVFALIPVSPSSISGPEGSATGRIGLFGAGIRASYSAPGSVWALTGGGGLSLVWLHFEGNPKFLYAAATADVLTLAPYLRVGLSMAITPRIRVRSDLLAGVTAQTAVVEFADRNVARWGAPFLAPSLGIELLWL